jgi:hypothetical protein
VRVGVGGAVARVVRGLGRAELVPAAARRWRGSVGIRGLGFRV